MGVFGTGIKYVLKDFSCWTSTHGLPHIGMANATWLRVFWIIVVIVCIGGLLWQIETLVAKYLSFSVNTETTLEFSERDFPTVTMCHLNPWKRDESAAADTNMDQLVKAYNDQLMHTSLGFEAGLTASRVSRAVQWTSLYGERLQNLSKTQDVSYTYTDLVQSCTYNAKTCNATDFEDYMDGTYGVCQKFNGDAHYTSSRAGPLYGLRMVIRTDQSDYLPWTETSGVVIVIHGENEVPYPDVLGYYAPPGTASSIGVRYVSTSREPAPYGDCTTRTTMESAQYDGDYAVEACYRACLQDKIVDTCGCYDPSYPHEAGNAPSCADAADPLDKMNCIEKLSVSSSSTFNIISDCDCPQPCEIDTYQVTVSTAQYPSSAYTPPDCSGGKGNGKGPWSAYGITCSEWYKRNSLLVEIYYERMNYQVLSESPAYSMVNLISDMGGQVGLFLGMSIISMLEFFFLALLLCCYCATHKSRKEELQKLHEDTVAARKETEEIEKKAQQDQLRNMELYGDEDDNALPPKVADL